MNFKRIIQRTGLLLLCLSFFQFSCYAQNTGINLTEASISLEKLFSTIEKQTNYLFTYVNADIKNVKTNIDVKNASIATLLDQAFLGTSLTYQVNGRNITIAVKRNNQVINDIISIKGTISNANGETMPGVNVFVKGTNIGAVTNALGQYTLDIPNRSATLLFSFMGYVGQSVSPVNRDIVDVTLIEDNNLLDEVVVVGYGVQKKVNLTGSIVAVTSKELGKRQVSNTSLTLQGLTPGIAVIQRSGGPNDGAALRVRGITSLGSSDPLILVDGIEMGLNNIDPNIIESISILKDAASTSIYGNRAAAGVVLITTKRASNQKVSMDYNTYIGWQQAVRLPNKVGAIDHMEMLSEAQSNVGITPTYSKDKIESYREKMLIDPDHYPNTDWFNELLPSMGFMQNHVFTVSGGTEKIKLLASLGYLDHEGIVENVNKKRAFLRINSDFMLHSKFKATVNTHLSTTQYTEPAWSPVNAIYWAMRTPANMPAKYSNGLWGHGWNGNNPMAFVKEGGLRNTKNPSATIQLGVEYNPFDWLTAKASYAPNYWQDYTATMRKPVKTYYPDGTAYQHEFKNATLANSFGRNLVNQLNASLDFRKNIGQHATNILIAFQQEDFRNDGFNAGREHFVFPEYPVLEGGDKSTQRNSGWASDWAMQSFFGRLNYVAMDKYLFEANFRYDGSSRFVKKYRWGLFPSFSAGWKISEEQFMKSVKNVLSSLKVRASWGKMGNQNIGNYPFASSLAQWPSYAFDEKPVNGAAVTVLPNSEISWEKTTITNLGLDFVLFKKVQGTVELFNKSTKDILLYLDIPLVVGMEKPPQNAGVVSNKGWEIALNYRDKIANFNFQVGVNLSDVTNKVVDIKGISNTGLLVNNEGYQMNSFYVYEAIGYIDAADYDAQGKYLNAKQFGNYGPGDIKYKDQNNDGEITDKDKIIRGSTMPRFTYGINLSGDFKGFDFYMLWQGVGKANGYLNGHGVMPFHEGGSVQEMHKNRWTKENPDQNALFPRLAYNEINNTQNSTFWIKDASFIKLRNLQIAYSLPQTYLKRLGISNLRIYVSGENLLSIDRFWEGFDPEIAVGDGSYYPQVRTISLGLNFKF